ncbi:hypothetical protein ABNR98_004428 [Salmonella enterica]
MIQENIYHKQQYRTATLITNLWNTVARYIPALLLGFISCSAYAAGGLDDATDVAKTVRTWIYTLDFVGAGAYMSWLGFMWYLGRKDVGDFAVGIGMVALIGGSIAGVTYAWSIWGSGGTI